MIQPRGFQFPDTSHLAPEDAELLRALYWERNAISRGEADRVRNDSTSYRDSARVKAFGDDACGDVDRRAS